MQYIGNFTPQANPSGSFNLQYNHGHFLFINESYANLKINLENDSFALQSGQCRMVCVNQSGTKIAYSTVSTLQIANAVDAVIVEYYAPGEKYLEQYPSTLTRQAIVGNVVQTSGGSVANLINDGNAVGTQIIESTPTGDASSAVSVLNDGTVAIGNATHKGSISLSGTLGVTGVTTLASNATVGGTLGVTGVTTLASNAVISGTLGVTGVATHASNATVGGTLGVTGVTTLASNATVGGTLGVTGASTLDNGSFTTDGAGNATMTSANVNTISNSSGAATQFKVNGTNIFQTTSTGPNLNANMTYRFLAGTLSRINGNVSTCGSGTVISHGLGATPLWYGGFPAIAQPGSATLGVGNGGTTTFTATVGAGTQLCWVVGAA